MYYESQTLFVEAVAVVEAVFLEEAAGALRLARHHLVEDHDALARRWAAFHLDSAAKSLKAAGVALPGALGGGLEKLANDPPGKGFKARDLWRIHTDLNLLVQSQGRGVSARLARGMPRVLRDSGLVLLTLLGLGIGYRKYRDFPVNLWSTQVSLMDMQVDQVSQGYGELQINKTVEKVPVMVDGTFYPEAFGTHAESRIDVSLLKAGAKLSGACGYPDSAHGGAIICTIEMGSQELYRSEVLSDKARLSQFQVPIAGVQKLTLHVVSAQPGINAAHAVWVDFKVHDD